MSSRNGRTVALKRWLIVAGFVAVGVAGWKLGLADKLRPEALIAHHETLTGFVAAKGALAALVAVLVYAGAVALSFPGAALLTVACGLLFGPWLGGALAVVGATLGAAVVFIIARTALGDALTRRAGPAVARMADGFKADAFSYLLFLRLVPAFPFWLVNLAAALLGVAPGVFVLATAIGIVPATFAFAFAGAGLSSVVAAQASALSACRAAGGTDCRASLDMGTLITPELLMAFVALGVLALIPIIARRLKRARPAPEAP